MKRNIWILTIAFLAFAAIPATAQFGNIREAIKEKPKQTEQKEETPARSNATPGPAGSSVNKDLPNDPDNYYIGANEMAGTSVGELRVCSDSYDGQQINWKPEFKQWMSAGLSDNARTKMFYAKDCELLGYTLQPQQRGSQYRKVDDLKEKADGLSVYQVENGELVLVKNFEAAAMYVVVAPRAAKDGLTMKDLVLCVSYELRGNYKNKVKSTSGCNAVESRVDYLGYYKEDEDPDEWTVNSALFNEAEFNAENKKGTFEGYKVYTLVGDNLTPVN